MIMLIEKREAESLYTRTRKILEKPTPLKYGEHHDFKIMFSRQQGTGASIRFTRHVEHPKISLTLR